MKKREYNSQKYTFTIQMTKCQRLVHMLTVNKPFCDKLNRFNNVEKKNGRDRAGGKAETKRHKIQNIIRKMRGNKRCSKIKSIAQNI